MRVFFQSMTSRVFLALIAGILVAMVLTLGLALGERRRMVAEFGDFHAVERVAQFIQSLETVPADLRTPFLAAASGIGVHAELAKSTEVVSEQRSELAGMLDKRLSESHEVFSAPTRPDDCPRFNRRLSNRTASDRRAACEAMLVTLPDGERLRLSISPPRPPPSFGLRPDFIGYGILFLISIGILAALIARMTMRPLKRLAQAATALGVDIERPPLPERGATEIRQAAAAFNAMQSRIRHHIRQRAHILAAITHDLQTPLTRLRLRLEKVDNPVNLDSLIDSVCADAADAGQAVTVSGKTNVSLMARPIALRRCLTNLIDNAVKDGQSAHVTATLEGSGVVIRIKDKGTGIAEPELEKVFEPFYRLENSRSRETGGSGLGLTIALNIVEQHGGTIRLMNHSAGGLEVILTLPYRR
jgi:signal transduction histidine kinase